MAEHAVFNIDVIGVSRLLVEEIEKFRLCSYTEKSQRYVLFDRDFVVPEEIVRAGMREEFVETIRLQNDFYHDLYERLRPHVFEKNPELAANPANRSLLEGWAKEDARYAIALATQTQLGMTVNARNLELMLRRLASLPLAEARLFSEKLYAATREIAPSLIRYTQATDYDRLTRRGCGPWPESFWEAQVKSRPGGSPMSGSYPRRPARASRPPPRFVYFFLSELRTLPAPRRPAEPAEMKACSKPCLKTCSSTMPR